jgi:hypothetical protein
LFYNFLKVTCVTVIIERYHNIFCFVQVIASELAGEERLRRIVPHCQIIADAKQNDGFAFIVEPESQNNVSPYEGKLEQDVFAVGVRVCEVGVHRKDTVPSKGKH